MRPRPVHPRHRLGGTPKGRLVVVSLLAYAVAAPVMFAPWPGLVAAVEQACGAPALDVRGSWTASEAQALLTACGTAGRAAYLRLQWADTVYPGVTALALALATRWLWARLGRRGWLIAAPALVAGALDYAENAVVWSLLLRWPDMPQPLAEIGGTVTTAKRVVATLAFVIPLGLVTGVIGQRLRAGSHQGKSP